MARASRIRSRRKPSPQSSDSSRDEKPTEAGYKLSVVERAIHAEAWCSMVTSGRSRLKRFVRWSNSNSWKKPLNDQIHLRYRRRGKLARQGADERFDRDAARRTRAECPAAEA